MFLDNSYIICYELYVLGNQCLCDECNKEFSVFRDIFVSYNSYKKR